MIRRMKIKKKGSALITTIILFAFITTVSTAFLSMSVGNYKARIVENKRVQNLYGAESGIDAAYNIIQNTVSVACQYGDYKVKKLKEEFNDIHNFDKKGYDDLENSNSENDDFRLESKKKIYALYADIDYWKYNNDNSSEKEIKEHIDEDKKCIDDVYNKYFQNNFIEFINNNLKTYLQGKEGTYVKVQINDNELKLLENEKLSYDDAEIDAAFKDSNGTSIEKIKTEINTSKNLKVKIEDGYDEDGKIEYVEREVEIEQFNKDITSNVVLLSTFKTNEANIKVGENERQIQTAYEMRLPNYDEVAFKTSENIKSAKELPGFTIGGDMDVKNVGTLEVNGDIFVQGNQIGTINKDNKYDHGIILNSTNSINKANINFNDNVYSRRTFNIKDNVNVNIKNNLYAKNIYASGDANISSNSEFNSKLNVSKETILDNDLTVKAKNTKIILNNFYGVNDKTIKDEEKPMKSSSIIINSPDEGSTVNIKNKAYIAGVAHIDTDSGYQTGESVAVKGNYKAYSSIVDGTEKFKYDHPLQVLDENDINKKIEHFKKYWNGKSVNCGGVTFDNITEVKSAGAIVDENQKVVVPQTKIEDSNLSAEKDRYAKKVFNIMGNGVEYDNRQDAETVSSILGEKFQGKVWEIVNNNKKFNFTKVYNGSPPPNEELNYTGNIIINGSAVFNKPVNITGNIIINGAVQFNDKANIKGIIVQVGELKFIKDFNLRGNMIVDGNLIMENSKNITLTYDKAITENMQNQYGDLFNAILGDGYGGQVIENDVDGTIKANGSNFIKDKLWKIKK